MKSCEGMRSGAGVVVALTLVIDWAWLLMGSELSVAVLTNAAEAEAQGAFEGVVLMRVEEVVSIQGSCESTVLANVESVEAQGSLASGASAIEALTVMDINI